MTMAADDKTKKPALSLVPPPPTKSYPLSVRKKARAILKARLDKKYPPKKTDK
jgi:hypothetical protein